MSRLDPGGRARWKWARSSRLPQIRSRTSANRRPEAGAGSLGEGILSLSYTPMTFHRPRFLAVALVPLLVWMLSGRAVAGGWYCASGRQCEPAGAPSCCCGMPQPQADCCDADAGADTTRIAGSCGCYYAPQVVDGFIGREVEAGAVSVAAPAPAPPHLIQSELNSTDAASLPRDEGLPPRLWGSCRATRGPPAV